MCLVARTVYHMRLNCFEVGASFVQPPQPIVIVARLPITVRLVEALRTLPQRSIHHGKEMEVPVRRHNFPPSAVYLRTSQPHASRVVARRYYVVVVPRNAPNMSYRTGAGCMISALVSTTTSPVLAVTALLIGTQGFSARCFCGR